MPKVLSRRLRRQHRPKVFMKSVYDNGDKEIRLLDTITGEEIEDGVINKVMIDDILSRLTEREKGNNSA